MRNTRPTPDASTSGAIALVIGAFGFLGGTALFGGLIAVAGVGSLLLG